MGIKASDRSTDYDHMPFNCAAVLAFTALFRGISRQKRPRIARAQKALDEHAPTRPQRGFSESYDLLGESEPTDETSFVHATSFRNFTGVRSVVIVSGTRRFRKSPCLDYKLRLRNQIGLSPSGSSRIRTEGGEFLCFARFPAGKALYFSHKKCEMLLPNKLAEG
jgi:hypothetical protein